MKLRDYIKETLIEIALGVQEAKIAVKDIVAIAPTRIDGEPQGEKTYVDFDVAVIVKESEANSKDGKASTKAEIEVLGVKVGGGLGGGINVERASATEATSRVSFKVPVFLNAHYRGDKKILEEAEIIKNLSK